MVRTDCMCNAKILSSFRVTDLTVSSSEAQSELVSQRKRNVQLEKQLGKVKVEQGSAAGQFKVKLSMSSGTPLMNVLVWENLKVLIFFFQNHFKGKRMKSKNLSASAISLRESVALDDPSVELEELQVK